MMPAPYSGGRFCSIATNLRAFQRRLSNSRSARQKKSVPHRRNTPEARVRLLNAGGCRLGNQNKESRNGQRRRKTLRKTRRRNFSADEHSRKRAPFAAILTCFKYPSTLSACAPIKREFSIKCRNPRKRTCQQLFVKIMYANCAQTNRPRPRHSPPFCKRRQPQRHRQNSKKRNFQKFRFIFQGKRRAIKHILLQQIFKS